MKLDISPSHYLNLMKKAYSLDAIYLLKLIERGDDIRELFISARITNVYTSLIRKGFVTAQKELTLTGKELLAYLDTDPGTMIVKKKKAKIADNFDIWWKAYPGTNTFTYKGKTFKGSRSIRTAKDKCRNKYEEIINSGEYTSQELLDALVFDVTQKKEASIKGRENKLTYMQNSLTYLNQGSYDAYVELIKEGAKIETSNSGADFNI